MLDNARFVLADGTVLALAASLYRRQDGSEDEIFYDKFTDASNT